MEYTFGEFLKTKRQEKKLTQKELSKILFVSESAISKWEKDVARPDITLLPKLSEILGVTEHELITASVDLKARSEKKQAKKWRILSFTWGLFFYIGYAITLITCFICNLAIDKTLSWFWIVLSALLLSFTFTNLPKLIKKHKLVLIPISNFLALSLLLGICCIYTRGSWFFIPIISVLFGLCSIFLPIYISKYKVFEKIKKYNDFVSVSASFILLNILLVTINLYTLKNTSWWYITIALSIVVSVYVFLNLLLSVRFLKINKLLKTSIILALIDLLYLLPIFIKVKNPLAQQEINDANILKANFSCWKGSIIENNIHLIIFLTLILLFIVFLTIGWIKHKKEKNN